MILMRKTIRETNKDNDKHNDKDNDKHNDKDSDGAEALEVGGDSTPLPHQVTNALKS